MSEQDSNIMQQVFELARSGNCTTQPNPMVGCIVVNDGEIVGQGYHQQAGQAHAERLALQNAGDKARGATVYVNLEPCCHQGRTPPCTDALINAGVSKVIAAMPDPNPLVAGQGFKILIEHGIEVVSGLHEDDAKWLNRGFVSRMIRKRPWLALKAAATLDGRTADHNEQSKWITGDKARGYVQGMRSRCSAVLTGIGTVLADDPHLNVRLDDVQRQPMRIVLDSHLRLPLEANIIGQDDQLIVFTLSQDDSKIAALTELGVEVVQQNPEQAQIDLPAVLDELAKWQCNEVVLEAGQTINGAFLQQNLVDELALFYAGTILGDQGRSMFAFDQPLDFAQRKHFRIMNVKQVAQDILVRAVNEHSFEQCGINSIFETE